MKNQLDLIEQDFKLLQSEFKKKNPMIKDVSILLLIAVRVLTVPFCGLTTTARHLRVSDHAL
jgi:hypothetical protein